MFVGNLAIALNLTSVAFLAFFIGLLLLSLLTPLLFPKLSFFNFVTRKFSLWLLVTGPWWIGGTCVALFWPRMDSELSLSWISNFAHWHHADLFNFTSWHGLTLLVCSLVLVWLLIVISVQSWNKSISMRCLLDLSNTQQLQNHISHKVYLLQSNIPSAFTSGLLSPKIYLTSALLKQMNQQQLDIIIQHELAHVRAYDPLFNVIFTVFCRFYPKPISHILMQHYRLVTEQMADNAATHYYDNLDIAQTLINVARLQQKLPSSFGGTQLSYFGNEQVSQRVHRLISPLEKPSELILLITILAFIGAPLIAASTVDSFHHFIETIFTH